MIYFNYKTSYIEPKGGERMKRKGTSIRFPDTMRKELQEITERRGLTLNCLLITIVEDYLEKKRR